ncbi:intracellular protein transport protein USO1-like isoform X1 [Mizuhopecten yessoensis]|uniref:intracellular protein transport protein USO1-like isoform X1 n=1 Tax=Mizuhopecten yessoensis TaxID=6573 RepID=UPI000B45AF2F|nr:intracellular protein transport protein USO1-like isoform X1 [Mizuhopecten yessoensis]
MGLEQLFWSTFYKKDASLLVQDISFQARKQMQVVEEEVKKLQTVPQVINEGVGTLNQTLCQDCKSKLLNKIYPPQGSITTKKDPKTVKRLPIECQNVIKDLEILLIKKEKLNKGGADDEEYCTTEEWHEQTISKLSAQHERNVEELLRELDNLKRETSDAKRREQQLIDQHERKIGELQKTIDSYEISIGTKNRTIENIETDRTRDRQRIKSLEDEIKTLDKRIIELSHPNPQGKSTQTELSKPTCNSQGNSTQTKLSHPYLQGKSTKTEPCETEKKSKSWFFFGPSKDEQLNAERMEHEKLRCNFRRRLQENEHKEKTLQERNKELSRALSQKDQSYHEKMKQITDLRKTIHARIEELDIVKEENAKLHSDIQSMLGKEGQTEATLQEKDIELARVHSRMDKIQNENTNIIADLQKKAEERQRQEKQLDDYRQEIQQLLNDLNVQDKELKTLRGQLEEMQQPRKKTLVIGLHCNRSGVGKSLVDMVVTELTKGVQDRLDRNNINLTIQFSQTPSEVTSWLQIVLCLNMSRVGTNILDSVKGIKGERDVFVLVLHHTSKNNLSSLTPTNHRVTGSELRQLGGILDIAFCSDSGLYECDVNSNTFDKIASVLTKYILL